MDHVSTLTIERLSNVYLIAPDYPAPEEVRATLDRLVTEAVDACRRHLAPLFEDSDPSVWVIRSLDLNLEIDASPYAAELAAAVWGEQLGLSIQRALNGDSEAGSVLRFKDHVEYVTYWVRDMAAGRAWDKWYYTDFESLRSLPQGAAIAEGILREGGEAQQILLRLRSQDCLEPVLDVLSENDARRLYDCVLPEKVSLFAEKIDWTPRLLALWNGVPLSNSRAFHDALRLFVAVGTESPTAAQGNLRQGIDGLLKLWRALAALSPHQIWSALAAISPHPDTLSGGLDGALLDFVRRASGGDPKWLEFAASVLSPVSSAGTRKEELFLTELGGIFLLANSFIHLKIEEALRVAAGTCSEPMRALLVLRHLLAVRCLGRERAALAMSDPAVVMFAQLERIPSLEEMARTLATADVEAAEQVVIAALIERGEPSQENLQPMEGHLDYFAISRVFPELALDASREYAWTRIAAIVLQNFARRLPGFARSSPEYLFQNFLSGTSEVRQGNGRVEIRLPQSPLTVVLRIAGMYGSVELPWAEGGTDGGEICLLAPAG
jgi:hypothetical protein